MSEGGAQDVTGRQCSRCGHPVDVDDHFCANCGALVGPGPTSPTAEPPVAPSMPAGQPPPPAPATPTAGPARRPWAPWVLAGLVLVAGAAVIVVLLVRDTGGGDSTPEAVEAPALIEGQPLPVTIDADPDAPRAHPVTLTGGDEATVFVTTGEPFTLTVGVRDPAGNPVLVEATALGNRGVAASFSTAASGEHTVEVDGFSATQPGYTAEVQVGARFTRPEDVPVSGCVDRWGEEPWSQLSGFLVVECDGPHEGQVFLQADDFGGQEQAAQRRCRAARRDRVRVPGYVSWVAYWGEDLTCVLVGRQDTTLDRSLVTA